MSDVTGRATPYVNTAVTNTVVQLTANPCFVSFWDIYTGSSTACYMQLFNGKAVDITLGTTVAAWSIPVITGRDAYHDKYLYFPDGLSFALTSGPTNAVVPVATAVFNIAYF